MTGDNPDDYSQPGRPHREPVRRRDSSRAARMAELFARAILILFSLGLVYATAAPIIHSNAWWIRLFDFPRVQIAALTGLVLAGFTALHYWRRLRRWEVALAAALTLVLAWQLIVIAPFTPPYPDEMAQSRYRDNSGRVSLLIYNVLMDNRKVEALRDLIRDTDPDLVLLLEPDQWWLERLNGLEDDYPYTIHQPQENEYGMLLYSRFELTEAEIRFLIDPEVPSLRTGVRLPSGTMVTLYGVHPRPPGVSPPGGNEGDGRNDTSMRDAELLVVAEEVRRNPDRPTIVAGDFNDVAWSHTTSLFQRIGGLLDPRVGRGLYNTFDTSSRFLRYPLDHALASQHFLLARLRRLPDIGSDHFPLLVVLDYEPDAAAANEEPQPVDDDAEEAEEAIEEGQSDN